MGEVSLKLKGDKGIWVIVVLFAMISIVSVFSSSSYLAKEGGVAKTAIFLEQTKSVLFGFAALLFCYMLPMKLYRALAFIVFGISVVMLILLFIPHFQSKANDAVRGLKIGKATLQVFEVAKIGTILYLAKALEMWEYSLDTYKDFFLKIALPVLAVCMLIVPNSVSSALLIGGVSILIMIFMDVKWKYILAMIGVVLASGMFLYSIYLMAFKGNTERLETPVGKIFNRFGTVENRISRFMDDQEIDESTLSAEEFEKFQNSRRQGENARFAIYEGGLLGKGPGKSTLRYSLSMAFSDFIYAFIVEEYGLLGGIFVIALYVVFLFRCLRICYRCTTTFSGAIVAGIAFLIVTQALLHILVNVRLLPITGHTLPLISHGGTAYLILSGAFGIILSVNRTLDKQDEMKNQQITIQNQQLGNYENESKDNY